MLPARQLADSCVLGLWADRQFPLTGPARTMLIALHFALSRSKERTLLKPGRPARERQRVTAVRALTLLDTGPEERFDRLTRLACQVFNVPIALISLVDANRQWFKSCQGIADGETAREESFCAHAILNDEALVIPDALLDVRFHDNPAVTGELGLRFYAGHPLMTPNGMRVGTLCIVDRVPRAFGDAERELLRDLAVVVQNEMLSTEALHEMYKNLQQSETRLRAVLDNIKGAVITVDENDAIESINAAGQGMFGYTEDDIVGRNLAVLLHPDCYREYLTYRRRRPEARCELIGLRRDATIFPIDLGVAATTVGSQVIYTVVARDISERKTAEAAMRKHAYFDRLTGLPNDRSLYERLRTRLSDNAAVSLLLVSLDGLSEFNSALGHQSGDQLLQQLGARLSAIVRSAEMIARLGGNEFAAVLPTNRAGAIKIARRIRRALTAPFAIGEVSVEAETNIGISVFPEHGNDADTLIRRADIALQLSKRTNAGYAVYDPSRDEFRTRRVSLLHELRDALAHERLELHYQPKVDLGHGAVIGAEALIRWQHPELGLLMPDRFIALAERTTLIRNLSLWVIESALQQAASWQHAGIYLPIAVNLSARNLHDDGLPLQIARLLRSYKVAPSALEVEITESAIMSDPRDALSVLAAIRALGVQLFVDDFGVGQSSLAYLKRLSADAIKIDKSFIIGMAHDADDAAIVRSTIDLAHRLGHRVVAEGIESAEVYARLSEMGCDAGQGFYIARPMPAVELVRWLEDEKRALAVPVRKAPKAAPVSRTAATRVP